MSAAVILVSAFRVKEKNLLLFEYLLLLTLKAPRKPASENVVCLCRLLNILAHFSNLFLHTGNSVDPDQTAPKGADLGSYCLQKWLLK